MSAKEFLIKSEGYVKEDFDSLNNEPMMDLIRLMESYARSILPDVEKFSEDDLLRDAVNKLRISNYRQRAIDNIESK